MRIAIGGKEYDHYFHIMADNQKLAYVKLGLDFMQLHPPVFDYQATSVTIDGVKVPLGPPPIPFDGDVHLAKAISIRSAETKDLVIGVLVADNGDLLPPEGTQIILDPFRSLKKGIKLVPTLTKVLNGGLVLMRLINDSDERRTLRANMYLGRANERSSCLETKPVDEQIAADVLAGEGFGRSGEWTEKHRECSEEFRKVFERNACMMEQIQHAAEVNEKGEMN